MGFDPSDYDDTFPSSDCEAAFRKVFGSRVGEDSQTWNEAKRFFVAGWEARNASHP